METLFFRAQHGGSSPASYVSCGGRIMYNECFLNGADRALFVVGWKHWALPGLLLFRHVGMPPWSCVFCLDNKPALSLWTVRGAICLVTGYNPVSDTDFFIVTKKQLCRYKKIVSIPAEIKWHMGHTKKKKGRWLWVVVIAALEPNIQCRNTTDCWSLFGW